MLINSPNISGSLTVTGNATISGSLTVAGGINAAITGSATSASYVEYNNIANKPTLVSGSEQVSFNGIIDKPTLVSGSSQVTYSGISSIPSGIVSSSTQITGYSIFATTGSNQFNGSQAITGSLTVTGQVIAQTLNVQEVTSSIVFSSGSNIFGNDLSNTQQFTGSLQVSGSSHYLFGNVGVGTDNPGSTLVIRGGNYAVANSGKSLGGIDILTTSSPGTGGYGGAISLGANGSGRAAIATVQGTSDNDNQGLAFFTHGSTGTSDSVERMRITSGGNVGIGTTDPLAKLEIKSSGDGDLFIARYSGGAAKLIYGYQSSADGFLELRTGADETVTKLSGYTGTASYFLSNVGIGTASITNGTTFGGGGQINRLKVQSTNYTCLEINGSTSGGSVQFTYGTNLPNQVAGLLAYNYANGAANEFAISNILSGPLIFATSNTERMRINSIGAIIQNGINCKMVKSGGTSVTFTITVNAIGAWTPGYATIRVAASRGGLQEHYAAIYFLRITYYQGSTSAAVYNIGGDTGAASVSVSGALVSSQSQITITVSDAGATTDYLIADLDASFQTGIASIT
jgi:hypothetical protein